LWFLLPMLLGLLGAIYAFFWVAWLRFSYGDGFFWAGLILLLLSLAAAAGMAYLTYQQVYLLYSGSQTIVELSAKTLAAILEMLTPTKATWNGHNSSGWKTDIVAANGFDERMEYGGEDRELGERMMNAGVKPLQIRYSAVCVHLDHARAYRNDAALARNMAIRQYTARTRATRTEFGITSAALPPGQAQVKSPDGPD
jgi:hypothetical protein